MAFARRLHRERDHPGRGKPRPFARAFRGHIYFLLSNVIQLTDFSQKHFTPNPVRAAELREIGPPGIQGWAVRVWPDLKKFIGITGGPAAASVPKVLQM